MLEVRPIELATVKEYIIKYHRHHKPPASHRFSISIWLDDELVGVAVCGRPVARMTNQLEVLEVTRVCTNGVPNGCSKLLGTAASIARTMGYKRIQTFTLDYESGASLRAIGWAHSASLNYGSWSTPGRERSDSEHTNTAKIKWWRDFNQLRKQ